MMMMKDARRSDENSVKTWLIHEIARGQRANGRFCGRLWVNQIET
jgi:hypothetical protein